MSHANTESALQAIRGMFFSQSPPPKGNNYMILAMLMRLAFDGAGLGNVVGFGGERSLGPSWTRFIGL
jgi:hypothetical protein